MGTSRYGEVVEIGDPACQDELKSRPSPHGLDGDPVNRARSLGMKFHPAKPGNYVYIHVRREELEYLREHFPETQVTCHGIFEGGAAGEGSPIKQRAFTVENPAEQADVLRLVHECAKDVDNELFRPYRYQKAGVFARQCEADAEVQVVQSADPVSLNEIEFVFKSPWLDKQQEVVMCQLSENDYLALNEPVEKEDGTFDYPDGEVYRVEGAAFDSKAIGEEGSVTRY